MNVRVELTRQETAVACAYDRLKRAILRAGGVAGALLLAGACSSAPPVKEMTGLELIIEVDGKVNPDDMNRAAPIEVRVYELKSSVAFEAADFYALQNDAKNTLSGDVLATDEFVLRPGASQTIRRRSNPETTAIGVLAGYRNLGKSVWRATWRLQTAPDAAWYRTVLPARKQKLKITLDQQAVSITEPGK